MQTRLLTVFLAATALLAGASESHARNRGAFEQHLRDAIRINQARLPQYSALSSGASEAVSNKLILSEKMGLPVAIAVDKLGHWWQERGVPIVAEDFIDMRFAPEFEPKLPNPQPLSAYEPQDGRQITRSIRKAQRDEGFTGVCRVVRVELKKLESAPTYHAMLRHVLESTLRAAHLAPKHEALARAKGLPSTAWLSRRLIGLNLLTLNTITDLDAAAAPIQAMGIPILHRDVPPIGTHSDFYDGPRSSPQN